MFGLLLLLLIGLALLYVGYRGAIKADRGTSFLWVAPLLFGAALSGIALFVLLIWFLIWLAVG